MSLKKYYAARLPDQIGPFFPSCLKNLNAAYGNPAGSSSGEQLHAMGRKFLGYKHIIRLQTADGYDWFWLAEFKFKDPDMTIMVAFPWSQDWRKRSGTQMDRSIAVFGTGAIKRAIYGRGKPHELLVAIADHFAKWLRPAVEVSA